MGVTIVLDILRFIQNAKRMEPVNDGNNGSLQSQLQCEWKARQIFVTQANVAREPFAGQEAVGNAKLSPAASSNHPHNTKKTTRQEVF